jgi:ribosomal protein S12 methylthiotransferase
MKKKSINLITLGCSKNLVDSEKILGQLSPDQFELMHDADQSADIVIVNTCGFIQDAKQESIDTILAFVEARKRGEVQELLITGCLSQRYREELKKEVPEVDAWFGVFDTDALFAHLKEKYTHRDHSRLLTTPSHYAYLKVSEGCDRSCAFCAIPLIRGKHRSVPMADLLDEAGQLARRGVKELILIAQDLSSYGFDLNGRSQLAPLVEALSEIDGIKWIRLHYAYPKNFPASLIPVMANNPKVCPYLDIPVQHINDGILRSMRRGHGKSATLDLIRTLRQQVPGIALRTTMLVGFPGETDEVFRELLDFTRQTRFERLGVFTYSPEEGTTAFALGNPVPEKIKQKRASELMALQQQISLEINESRVGQVLTVVIDSEGPDYFIGRTAYDSPEVDNEVVLEKSPGIAPGDFIQAEITGAGEFELFARLAIGLSAPNQEAKH